MEDPSKVILRVGRRIAELRRKSGKTQEELAEELGVGWRYVSRAERGRENLTLETLVKIATGLRVKTKDLLEEPAADVKKIRPGRPKKRI